MYLTVVASIFSISCLDEKLGFISPRGGTEDGSQEWGDIPLRPNASMFYWFYRTTHPDGYRNRPIVLWLQGGPGVSGTGVGNFLEIGPLDQNLNSRNSTWIQTANVLFVDNPAGVGFSVADYSSVAKSIEEISFDLLSVLKTFMDEHSYFRSNPFYVFGQSYGGKMAASFTADLHKAIQNNEIQCNLKGVGIGNGFVSPIDSIGSWPSMVYEMSLIDDVLYSNLSNVVQNAYYAVGEGHWDVVYDTYVEIMEMIYANVPGFNIYKVTDITKPRETWGLIYDTDINALMNKKVKKVLGIIPDERQWEIMTHLVFLVNIGDFGKPVWHLVDEILKTSDIDVIVYSGQLDVICSTAGTLAWIQRLTWPGLEEYNQAARKTLANPYTQKPEMFVKSHDHLKMYWILNAGHVVPVDVPDAALRMLDRILDDTD